ncbi:MAG: hypothetical protein FJX72_13120, partial [Armatimonadetes bacterium]|nr:hypothetical protein [Armatimonadota bacterium]
MISMARRAAILAVCLGALTFVAPPVTAQGKAAPKVDSKTKAKSGKSDLTVLPGLSNSGSGGTRVALLQEGQGTPPPGGQATPPPGGQVTPPPGGQTTPPPGGQVTPPPAGQVTPPQGGSTGQGRDRERSRFGGFGSRSTPFGGGGTITLDFRGSDIGNVLKFFAMATNWQIVPDAALTGPVTIISPKPLTLDQAFQVLQSTLEVRGFSGQIEKRGETTILKIVPLDRAVQSTSLLGGPDSALNADEVRGQVITQVIPIENVDAASLSRELQ